MIHPARYPSLGAILEDAFLQYPSDTACIEVERQRENVRLTYAAFRRSARRVAAWLAARGVGPDDRVAIVMGNQAAWLLTATAALHLGAVVVPLDARLAPDELDALLRHARARVLVTEPHLLRRLADGPPLVVVTGAEVERDATPLDAILATEGDVPLAPRTRDDLATIVYSSGTGGAPKGCMLTHGNYLAQYGALAETFAWRRGDRYLSILPTNHAIDFMCGFLASLCTGATVVWQRTLRPELIVETMRRYRITQVAVVPMILRALKRGMEARLDEVGPERRRVLDALTSLNGLVTRAGPRHEVSRWLLKPVHDALGGHLRVIFCGGAFTDPSLVAWFRDLGLPVAVGYGLTEACTVVTVDTLRPIRGDTVGQPLPGVEVRVADPDADGVGEVQVRGPTVFAGYLDDPEQTAEAFDGPWLRTGDLGWIDGSHHLRLVGRRKNMIVTAGGKNVHPEDVENAFAEAGAEELCVVAEDFVWPRRGLEGERLIALVRPGDAARSEVRARIAAANRRLPEHKRIGGLLWWDAAFPRTASLKVKRGELATVVAGGASREQVEALG